VALPSPDLDTRTFDDLVEEARTRIPRLAPGWTDHNAHDPGITLVELSAWLTELLLFRADRVGPASRRACLRLAGVEPRPAGVASTVVALRRAPGAGPITAGPGLLVTTAAGDRRLESQAAVPVSPAWLELEAGETTRRGVLETPDGTADQTTGRRFAPFGARPAPGAALAIGFEELPAAPGEELRLYAWTPTWEQEAEPVAGEHHDVRVSWEYLDATTDDWRPLAVLADGTRALTQTGTVQLRGPAVHPRDAASGRYWIRCRLASGAHDCPPELALIAVNPVRVLDAVRRGPESLGRTRGAAHEGLPLAERPVVAGSTELEITRADGHVEAPWHEVAEWDRSGPADRHYRLDPLEGVIAFGDGATGRVPAAGSSVTARYRVGGGSEGNLPAGRLVTVPGTALAVVQPFPAIGGAPAEPFERAHARALARLQRPARGVTLADLEALAVATPGARIGRAVAVPGHHPAYGCIPADGVVTLIVLPACGDPPMPSPGLLAAVRRHLCPTRILTCELHVTAPSYVPVSVTATLHVSRGVGTTAAEAAAALARFLDPLRGGEDGRGWPFGRPVLDSEVMAVLGGLEGVRFVGGVGISGPADAVPRCGRLPLCPLELPDSGLHRITVEES
jgi:predicted phage baseplate assembly protein